MLYLLHILILCCKSMAELNSNYMCGDYQDEYEPFPMFLWVRESLYDEMPDELVLTEDHSRSVAYNGVQVDDNDWYLFSDSNGGLIKCYSEHSKPNITYKVVKSQMLGKPNETRKTRPHGQKKLPTDSNCLYNVVEFPSTLSSKDGKTASIKVGAYSDEVPKTNMQVDLCNKWFDQLHWFQHNTYSGNRGTLMMLNQVYLNTMDFLIKRDPEWVKAMAQASFDHTQLLDTNAVHAKSNEGGSVYTQRYGYSELPNVDHEKFVKLPMPRMVAEQQPNEPTIDPNNSVSNKDAHSTTQDLDDETQEPEVSIVGVSHVSNSVASPAKSDKPRKLADGSPIKRTPQYPKHMDKEPEDGTLIEL